MDKYGFIFGIIMVEVTEERGRAPPKAESISAAAGEESVIFEGVILL